MTYAAVPAVFSTHNPKYIWAGLSKIKATVKKARAQFDLTQSIIAIQICLDSFLETFGLIDFAVLVVLPLIILVLRYRYDEQDDAGVVVGRGSQEPDYEQLTKANEVCLLHRYPQIF